MPSFEHKLQRLEQLTKEIKSSDISLEEALKDFEEGIKLCQGLENELNKIEGKVQILMNGPSLVDNEVEEPQLELFTEVDETGSSGKPKEGTRQ